MEEINMQALCVTGVGQPKDVMVLQERELPQPGPGELQIKVAAAGMGLPDVLMCKGEYAFSPELPFTPGQEVAGVVTAVGEGCTTQVGERVMGVTSFYTGNGSYAQYCIAPESTLYPMTQGMSAVEAAAFCIPFHTAIVSLKLRAALQADEVLLVHGGAGGSGSAAIQLGKALGAQVIATASSEQKLDYCRSQGADHCVNYREQDFSARVLELTAGRGADVIFDPVGGEIFERSVSCTASGGRVLAVGFASGRWGTVDTEAMVMRNCSTMGVFAGAYGHEEMLVCHEELLKLYTAGKLSLQPEVAQGLESVVEYLTRLKRREIQGKVVVAIEEGF
ncbi:MAG: NADPH:quinone oxidoreductase family protein [Halioglobus sp.]